MIVNSMIISLYDQNQVVFDRVSFQDIINDGTI